MADRLETLIQNAKELTANVSHELRSPLTRLRLSKELIADKLDGKKAGQEIQRYIDNMESDIRQLDALVDHMLTLSRMDYQGPGTTRERFSFSAFLDECLAAYQPLAGQARLNIETRLKGPLTVCQDKSVVKSILCNLLDNAIKYSTGGNTITIQAQAAPDKGLYFSVANPCPRSRISRWPCFSKPFTGSRATRPRAPAWD